MAACSTTVVIQTQPSSDTNNEGQPSNEAANNTDWLQSLTANTTMHVRETLMEGAQYVNIRLARLS